MPEMVLSVLTHPRIVMAVQHFFTNTRLFTPMEVVEINWSDMWTHIINHPEDEEQKLMCDWEHDVVVNEDGKKQSVIPGILPFNYMTYAQGCTTDFDFKCIDAKNKYIHRDVYHGRSLIDVPTLPFLKLTCKHTSVPESIDITFSVTKPYLNVAIGSSGAVFGRDTGYSEILRLLIIKIGKYCDNANDLTTCGIHTLYSCRARLLKSLREQAKLPIVGCISKNKGNCGKMHYLSGRENGTKGSMLIGFPWGEVIFVSAYHSCVSKEIFDQSRHSITRYLISANIIHSSATKTSNFKTYTAHYSSIKSQSQPTRTTASSVPHWFCAYKVLDIHSIADAMKITGSFVN